MNPLEKYNSIIINRQKNPLDSSEYGEVHHIIPRSCGGGNAEWNLVKLTPEEHYRVHELLPFIYTEGKEHAKMVQAWRFMSHTREGLEISDEEYGILKRVYASLPGPNAGKRFTEETRRKMSEAHAGQVNWWLHGATPWNKGKTYHSSYHPTDEHKRKISESHKGLTPWNKGKHLSEEDRRKKSIANKGHKPWNTGRKHSPETIKKMSEARKRYYENKRKENAA